MPESGVQLGLVGCGRWGRNILRDLRKLDCGVHVVDPDASARMQAKKGGAQTVCPTLEALPPGLAGFVVACPTATHASIVQKLLLSGRPIFCEKPLAPSTEACRQIAEAGADRVFVMDKWRYHPGVDALAEIVRSGELGSLLQLRTRRVQWGQPHSDVDGSWILLPHDISICQHILGALPEPQYALGDYTGRRLDGVFAVLGKQPRAVLEVSAREPATHRQISVTLSDGSAYLPDPLADHILIYRGEPSFGEIPEKRAIDTEFPLMRELRIFRDYLKGGPPPLSDAWTAYEQTRCIEKLRYMAAHNGMSPEGTPPV